jgi:hypothetical protein
MKTLAAFYYRNELYIRLIPAKPLFNSTLVHEVVNRGDVFAMRVADQKMTVLKGIEKITPVDVTTDVPLLLVPPAQANLFPI